MCVAVLDVPSAVVRNVGSISERWRFKGPMRGLCKPRSALDEGESSSDRDFLNLTNYQALCLVRELCFRKFPAEVHAADERRVPCARRWKRPERIMELECEAALWPFRSICRKAYSWRRQHLILSDSMSSVCGATKCRTSFWTLARRAREMGGLCLASIASVRYRWFQSERNPADEPSRRFEWSSPHHARFRDPPSAKRGQRDLACDDRYPPGVDGHAVQRVKTEESLRALLGSAAAVAAQEPRRAANCAAEAFALPPGFALDER